MSKRRAQTATSRLIARSERSRAESFVISQSTLAKSDRLLVAGDEHAVFSDDQVGLDEIRAPSSTASPSTVVTRPWPGYNPLTPAPTDTAAIPSNGDAEAA